MKFIYWFAYFHSGSPSVRYRAKYPLETFWKEHGIGYHLVMPGYSPRHLRAFARAYLSALLFRKRDSVIVIQRVRSRFIYAMALKLLVKLRPSGTIYDLDDADYLEDEPGTIHHFARECERISAGSEAIRRHLQGFNSNVTFLTSPVVDLGIVKQRRSPVFTVGWIGEFSGGHKEGLVTLLFPAVKELGIDLRLVLIGVRHDSDRRWIEDHFATCSSVHLDIPIVRSWEDERWIQQRISDFDVGIATLVDTALHRAKSGIKAKQYMNNGVPVLSTDLPENNTVVVHGVNGYFFSGIGDLQERLSDLHSMSDVDYGRLCANARASTRAFNHDHYYRSFKNIALSPPRP